MTKVLRGFNGVNGITICGAYYVGGVQGKLGALAGGVIYSFGHVGGDSSFVYGRFGIFVEGGRSKVGVLDGLVGAYLDLVRTVLTFGNGQDYGGTSYRCTRVLYGLDGRKDHAYTYTTTRAYNCGCRLYTNSDINSDFFTFVYNFFACFKSYTYTRALYNFFASGSFLEDL